MSSHERESTPVDAAQAVGMKPFVDDMAIDRLEEARRKRCKRQMIETPWGLKPLLKLPEAEERRYSPPDKYCYIWDKRRRKGQAADE